MSKVSRLTCEWFAMNAAVAARSSPPRPAIAACSARMATSVAMASRSAPRVSTTGFMAISVREDTATMEAPVARDSARAADTAMRAPVNVPGPVAMAMRSSSSNRMPASAMTDAIFGISRSAWPVAMGSAAYAIDGVRLLSLRPAATEQASKQVSSASRFIPA